MDSETFTLLAEQRVVRAFGVALQQDGQAHSRIRNEGDQQPACCEDEPFAGFGQSGEWRNEPIGQPQSSTGSGRGEPQRPPDAALASEQR